MSLDYPQLNPQPVSFSSGSVHVTNLDTTEGYLASIDTNTASAATSLSSTVDTRDIKLSDILQDILVELKILNKHQEKASDEIFVEEDTKY